MQALPECFSVFIFWGTVEKQYNKFSFCGIGKLNWSRDFEILPVDNVEMALRQFGPISNSEQMPGSDQRQTRAKNWNSVQTFPAINLIT